MTLYLTRDDCDEQYSPYRYRLRNDPRIGMAVNIGVELVLEFEDEADAERLARDILNALEDDIVEAGADDPVEDDVSRN